MRGALPLNEVEAALAALGVEDEPTLDERPFVHLCVEVDGPAVGLKAEIDAIAERYPIRLVSLAVERPRISANAEAAPRALQLAERAPVDLFCEAFEREHKTAPSSDHLTLFHAAATRE
jgi:exonuclease SbcD